MNLTYSTGSLVFFPMCSSFCFFTLTSLPFSSSIMMSSSGRKHKFLNKLYFRIKNFFLISTKVKYCVPVRYISGKSKAHFLAMNSKLFKNLCKAFQIFSNTKEKSKQYFKCYFKRVRDFSNTD